MDQLENLANKAAALTRTQAEVEVLRLRERLGGDSGLREALDDLAERIRNLPLPYPNA